MAGDIGCYTLGVMEPYQAMDTCVAMGASLGVGLGLRHVLPEEQAREVVSIIGDSTFIHTGLNGLVEMVYNPPETGHVLIVLDNGTTAMTGQQEHPGTGRTLDHDAHRPSLHRGVARAAGGQNVDVVDPVTDPEGFEQLWRTRLAAQRALGDRGPAPLHPGRRRHPRLGEASRKAQPRRRCAGCAEGAEPLSAAVTNVVVAGLGGQGAIKASDILADAAFRPAST